jgi:hypothetical protein
MQGEGGMQPFPVVGLKRIVTHFCSKVLVAFLLLHTCHSYAATPQIDSQGQLTGATGVVVNSVAYDVEFIDGTCADLFSGCDSLTDFPFSQGESADAAFALLNQVFLNTPDGAFDDIPNLTRGCERELNCKALTPVSLGSSSILTSRAARNDERNGGFDSIFLTTLLSGNVDLTTDDDQVWAVWSTSVVNQTRYDVADDWSDIQNPNGVWTYTGDSGTLLTINQTDWDPGNSFFSVQQQAWADAIFPTPGHVPMWFRTLGPSALDVTGVGMHGSEGGNVAWVGVVWTSPTDGTINIDGGVWHALKAIDPFGSDHRDRNSDWRLRHNNTVLASGNVSGTDGFSSASPFTFSAGSNGTSLSDIPVVAGDDLVLEFISPTSFATFIGIDFAVTLNHPTPVSTPQCDIQLNQATYIDGETVTLDVFRLANLTAAPIALEVKFWLGLPAGSSISVINQGSDGSLVAPTGWDIDLGPLPLLPVSSSLPRGNYEFSCRMLDPVTGELLTEDRDFFSIQ